MPSSLIVANRFLDMAKVNNDSLTPMQLLKLVYIAHGWMLGLHGRPLIEENVEAWKYGPVIRELYDEVRHYKGRSIKDSIRVNEKVQRKFLEDNLFTEERDIIQQVYDEYADYSGIELSRITHAKGTPWSEVYMPGSFGEVIPIDLIEQHYKDLSREIESEESSIRDQDLEAA